MKFDVKIKVLECEFSGIVEARDKEEAEAKAHVHVVRSFEVLKVEPTSKDITIDSTYNFLCQK